MTARTASLAYLWPLGCVRDATREALLKRDAADSESR